jgi:hypothetical protein
MAQKTVFVSTTDEIESNDDINDLLTQHREHEPDTFIVKIANCDSKTMDRDVLPYAIGYMGNTGYGLVDVAYCGEKVLTFAKIKESGETVEDSNSESSKFKQVVNSSLTDLEESSSDSLTVEKSSTKTSNGDDDSTSNRTVKEQ